MRHWCRLIPIWGRLGYPRGGVGRNIARMGIAAKLLMLWWEPIWRLNWPNSPAKINIADKECEEKKRRREKEEKKKRRGQKHE